VHNGRSFDFRETWLDDRADMVRLPGIIACALDRDTLQTLANLARDWNPRRYND
jgi:3'(2'), 5'-bisphosphate nucleotidase